MSEQRIPKPGEVWKYGRFDRPVVNVYPDAVTFEINDHLNAATLQGFLDAYAPPEPAVVDVLWLSSAAEPNEDDRSMFTCWAKQGNSTHRLDLMSDGEFRVVKL